MNNIEAGINTEELVKLAKQDPAHTQLYASLYQIDQMIKTFIRDTIENYASYIDSYYVKTTMTDTMYTVAIYNSDVVCTAEFSYPMADFLIMCKEFRIEFDIIDKTKKCITALGSAKEKNKKIYV